MSDADTRKVNMIEKLDFKKDIMYVDVLAKINEIIDQVNKISPVDNTQTPGYKKE